MTQVADYKVNASYIWACLKLYWGNGWIFPVLLAAALLLILFRMRKSSGMLLLWCSVLLCLTVYNPLLIRFFVPRIMERETYYRTFWLLPVIPGAAYLGAHVLGVCKKRWVRSVCMLLLLGLVLGSSSAQVAVTSLKLPTNIYKVPRSLVWAADEIHKDFAEHQDEIQAFYKEQQGKENVPRRPYAVYGAGLMETARQYDPAIRMAIKRNTQLLFYGTTTIYGTIKQKKYRRARVILGQLSGFRNAEVEEFREALVNKYISYIIIYSGSNQQEFFERCGLELVGENYGCQLYRFLPKKEYLTEYALWKKEKKAK